MGGLFSGEFVIINWNFDELNFLKFIILYSSYQSKHLSNRMM